MWKRNTQIVTSSIKPKIKRLHLDKKQNCHAFPVISSKEQKSAKEILKNDKNSLQTSNSKKKFSLNTKHRTVVPFLINRQNESEKSLRSFEKTPSKSENVQKQKPVNTRKQSQSRMIIRNKSIIMRQKQGKTLLHLQQHNKPIVNTPQNNKNSTLTLQKNDLTEFDLHSDWFSTSNNTIFQDNQSTYPKQNKPQPKQYQSIEAQTELQMSSQTFKDFIKFKITQKQKYQKLQDIFNFVDDISHKQMQKMTQRYEKVKRLCNEPLQSVREQQVKHIIDSVQINQQRFLNFMDVCVNKISKSLKNQISINIGQVQNIKEQLHQLKKQINKFVQSKQNNNILTKNEESSFASKKLTPQKKIVKFQKSPMKSNRQEKQNNNKNFLSLEIHQKFSKIINNLTGLQMKIENDEQDLKADLNESQLQFRQVFQTWKFNMQQKNYAIKVCVGDILRLPEMSLSIFGMSDQQENRDEREILRKIGVFLDDIPQFDEFFSGSNKKKDPQHDFCFKQMLQYKCLNCAYLKSKMRFIYSKNKELSSVIKMLNHLLNHDKQVIRL